MIVGIDVHKQSHAAALLDDRGGEIDTLVFANSPNGYRRLMGWLVDHGAEGAVVGVESPGAYGRCLVTALVTAGYETLQVPAWRTHRERHRQGPGKTDPGDAISIAQVVLRKRRDLGPAMEPPSWSAFWACSSYSAVAWCATAPRRFSACGPTGPSSTRSRRAG